MGEDRKFREVIQTDKQSILDVFSDIHAEHRHAERSLEKMGLPEAGEAYRRLKRINEWYDKQAAVICEIVKAYNPEERK